MFSLPIVAALFACAPSALQEASLPVLQPGASLAGFQLADLVTGAPRELVGGGPVLLVLGAPHDDTLRAALAQVRRLGRELAEGEGPALRTVPVVRELHADRARLLLEWLVGAPDGFSDPFHTLAPGARATTALVDAAGLVVAVDVPLDDAAALRALLRKPAPAPAAAPVSDLTAEARAALLRADLDEAVQALEARASAAAATPLDLARAGHARWLRHLARTGPGDAVAAFGHWRAAALRAPDSAAAEPARRFGPRLAKRAGGADWPLRARYELAERGVDVADLAPPPTAAELLGPSTELPRLAEREVAPDPAREVAADTDGLLRVETADMPNIDHFAPGAAAEVATARVFITVVPGEGVLFDPDAPAPVLWIVVPQGVGIDRNLYVPVARRPLALARTAYDVDFEVLAAPGMQSAVLRGYVLAHVLDRQGRRAHVRRDLRITCTLRPGT